MQTQVHWIKLKLHWRFNLEWAWKCRTATWTQLVTWHVFTSDLTWRTWMKNLCHTTAGKRGLTNNVNYDWGESCNNCITCIFYSEKYMLQLHVTSSCTASRNGINAANAWFSPAKLHKLCRSQHIWQDRMHRLQDYGKFMLPGFADCAKLIS